jgi:hypothetical protein
LSSQLDEEKQANLFKLRVFQEKNPNLGGKK